MSEWRTSRVDINFKVNRLNFGPPRSPPSMYLVLNLKIKENFVFFFLNDDTYKYWHLPILSLHE